MTDKRIRIELDEVAHKSRVFVPTDDGEVEISNYVRSVDVHAKIGEITTVSLAVLLVNGEARGVLDKLILSEWTPARARLFRLRRWLRRLLRIRSRMVEVTAMRDHARRYIGGKQP